MPSNTRLLAPSPEQKQTSNNFDLIRIAMALLVVWSHSFALFLGSERTEPLSVLTGGIINSGNLGVFVFFMVSGYLITQSFDRSTSLWSFLKKRIARIYPGFLVATCICAFIIAPLYSSRVHLTAWLVAKTLGLNLLLQGYFPNNTPFVHNPVQAVDGSLWSISFEFWCYLGVLALGIVGLIRARRRGFLLALFALILLIHAWLEISGRRPGGGFIGLIIGWPYLWFKMLPCFMAGMLVYQYRDRIPKLLWLAIAGPIVIVLAAHLPFDLGWKTALVGILFPPLAAYSIFYLAFAPQIADVARYGDFSYGTYLYAFPLQQMLLVATGFVMPFWALVIVSLILSLAAGIASWYTVERWFNLSARKRLHAAPVPPPSSEELVLVTAETSDAATSSV